MQLCCYSLTNISHQRQDYCLLEATRMFCVYASVDQMRPVALSRGLYQRL